MPENVDVQNRARIEEESKPSELATSALNTRKIIENTQKAGTSTKKNVFLFRAAASTLLDCSHQLTHIPHQFQDENRVRAKRICLLLYVLLYWYSTWWLGWLVDGRVGRWEGG